jgi:hypothetical protein
VKISLDLVDRIIAPAACRRQFRFWQKKRKLGKKMRRRIGIFTAELLHPQDRRGRKAGVKGTWERLVVNMKFDRL